MKENPIYISHEQFTDSWNDNHLHERMLTDSGYFVSLEDALSKAWEFVSKAYKKYVDQYEERYRDIGYTTPPKFEEIDNGFRATSWDLETIYQCTVECIYQNNDGKMTDEEFTISKQDLIDILTKSGIFNSSGIEIVLSRDGLKGVLAGMMVEIDNSHSRADYYKNECSRLRDKVHDLESLVDKYENMSES